MRAFSLLLLSACGIVHLDIPDVSRDYALTISGCGEDLEIFSTTVSIDQMKQKMAGFRGCIEKVDDASLALSSMDYGRTKDCATPHGSVSGMVLSLDYKGGSRTVTCDNDTVDLSDKNAVLAAFNKCLSRAAARKQELIEALNASEGDLTARLLGRCSQYACFGGVASLNVELNGITATNCM